MRKRTGGLAAALFLSLGIGAVEARYFNVTGRILYEDGDARAILGPPTTATNGVANIRRALARVVKVYIKEGDDVLATGTTDSQGRFTVPVKAANGTGLGIWLEVDNFASRIWADTDCVNEPVHIGAGGFNAGSSGDVNLGDRLIRANYHNIQVGECTHSENLDVSPAAYLNINEVVLASFADASANRDPGESDSIGQVYVEYCDEDWNHYFSDLVLTCWDGEKDTHLDYGFRDFTIAHEYAHHLQWEIGVVDLKVSSGHDDCEEIDHTSDDDAELAWAEGFPDYFANHLLHYNPGVELAGNGNGTCDTGELCDRYFNGISLTHRENECSPSPTYVTSDSDRTYSVENHISGALWDLSDGIGRGEDAWDLVDGPAIGGHKTIIQIFDKELDDFWYMLDAPALPNFYAAWVGRKGTSSWTDGQPVLDMILNRMGIVPRERLGFFPGNKMPPHAFLEANPLLPRLRENNAAPGGDGNGACDSGEWCTPGMSGTFDLASRSIRLDATWSYSDAWGSLGELTQPIVIHLGVSNLGDPNMPSFVLGSSDQADSASYNGANVTFPTGNSGWLSVTGATGTLQTNALPSLTLQLDGSAVLALPIGTHEAEVPVRFDINTKDGRTLTRIWTIEMDLYVSDNRDDDRDGDGLSNLQEIQTLRASNPAWYGCLDPTKFDSDDDMLSDGEEFSIYHSNPCSPDTDGDGAGDWTEAVASCLDPILDPDPGEVYRDDYDGDGIKDDDEGQGTLGGLIAQAAGLHPACTNDVDGDGVLDAVDNCPYTANPLQEDDDGNGVGNACERLWDLEQWLKNATLPDPGDLLPQCPGGCGPLPPWLRDFPWEPLTHDALVRNGVEAVDRSYQVKQLTLQGSPQMFAFGANESVLLHMSFTMAAGPLPVPGGEGGEASNGAEGGAGVYAMLIDAVGTPVWIGEGVTDILGVTIELEAGQTYLLLVNGEPGVGTELTWAMLGSSPIVVQADKATAGNILSLDFLYRAEIPVNLVVEFTDEVGRWNPDIGGSISPVSSNRFRAEIEIDPAADGRWYRLAEPPLE